MSFFKISIITVVYNAADTLEYTLKSVVDQSYKNIEYIIIDGQSTDGTLEIINRYVNKISTFISEKDHGIFDAMNKGLKYATGDWVLFLGADDLLLSPTIIEEFVNHFTDKKYLYYGNTYFKQSNIIYNGKTNRWRIAYGNISHQAMFYPKHVYKEREYELKYPTFADHVYNVKLYGDHPDIFKYIHNLLTIYNQLGYSSRNSDIQYHKDINAIIKRKLGFLPSVYVLLRKMIDRYIR
ncbi:glycosyltransferase family 2 protein [Siphonobacter sp. SORGH_AS_1065]|uniref:glycosyltransferase family 2 protein n=1 Tax=Siphonobacter sp. SORGH_AS_1065 TaxID=3041795 RepID=UPI002780E48B|nr:glycosyltransferase family 2 protein [Siphonobacter sp. SORGH_AS_1065]MDQ1087551.1 glycosyltransferase involved in cell wall biosynthesis [Siphonobacter sp. SORGH_AS_1065]